MLAVDKVLSIIRAEPWAAGLSLTRFGDEGKMGHQDLWQSTKARQLPARAGLEPTPRALRSAGVVVREQTDVLLTTLSKATAMFRPNADSFSAIVIDEAGNALEPIMMPVLCLDTDKFLVVGDTKQLPPLVLNRASAILGLSRSPMERMIFAGVPARFLATQRRMHPAIADVVRDIVYGGVLQDPPGQALRRTSLRSFFWALGPVSLVEPVSSHQAAEGTSLVNEGDAFIGLRLLRILDRVQALLLGVDSITVMVVSPYSAQVQSLR